MNFALLSALAAGLLLREDPASNTAQFGNMLAAGALVALASREDA